MGSTASATPASCSSATIDRSDFGFYGNDGSFIVETGRIDVYAGNSSRADLRSSFTVTR